MPCKGNTYPTTSPIITTPFYGRPHQIFFQLAVETHLWNKWVYTYLCPVFLNVHKIPKSTTSQIKHIWYTYAIFLSTYILEHLLLCVRPFLSLFFKINHSPISCSCSWNLAGLETRTSGYWSKQTSAFFLSYLKSRFQFY